MAIGELIGQYRIVGQIGEGGMGTVYVAEHVLLGRRAAVKTLLARHAIHAELVERFFNEARAASAISDPGVVQIFDFGYHVDGSAYIVMELLDGESLAERLERCGRLEIADALRIARQVASSLAVAHARGIVHRDLKPENIHVVPDLEAQGGERTKILDFGVCKLTDDHGGGSGTHTEVGTTVGTPAYMAPEQCRGVPDIDHRADVYAFGCLLFHMLAGRPPFEGTAPGDLLVAHVRDQPPAPSDFVELPPELDALVARCLAKSPAARYQSMTQVGRAIGDVAHALGIAAGATSSARTLDMPASEPKVAAAPEPELEIPPTPVQIGALRPRVGHAIAWIAAVSLAAAATAGYVIVSGDEPAARADALAPQASPPNPMTTKSAATDAQAPLPPLDAAIADAPAIPIDGPAVPSATARYSARAPARISHKPSPAPAAEDLYDTR